ncbi:MAG: sulfatase [Gemmatimonadetes bacterium]|nr:sulfatase [Gemmatimonadota bacterium]
MIAAPPSRIGTMGVLRLAAAFGLVGGLLESLANVARWEFESVPLRLGLYLTWMPAAANLLFFLAIGLLVAGLHAAWPRVVTPGRMIGLFGTLAGMAALREFDGQLGVITVDLIALGLGVQAAQRLGGRWTGVDRVLRRAVPVVLAVLTLTAVGIEVRYRVRERRAVAGLPAAAAGAPNVLLLILDTVRAQSLSAYGYRVPTTPVLAGLAAEGVRFARAYAPAPWTLASHASIMTGRWPHQLSADWEVPLDDADSTLAEALAARGYRTGGMVANLSYTGRWTGLARGFQHYAEHPLSLTQVLRTSAFTSKLYDLEPLSRWLPPARLDYRRKTAREVNAELLAWLDRGGDRPFFAFLNYLDAHREYLPMPPFDTAFAAIEYPALPPAAHGGLYKDDRPRPMRPYDQAIASIDHEIGRLLADLRSRGLLENTIVIVTSDHGEEFGEHGFYGHGHTLYLPAVAVPLVLAWPGRLPAGTVVEARTSLRDLAATVLDLAAPGGTRALPGRSLARFWQPGTSSASLPDSDTLLLGVRWARNRPTWDATSRGDLQGVLTQALSLVRDVDQHVELYDLAADSGQQRNLAPDSAWAPATAALQSHLDREAGPPRRGPR